MMNPQVQIPNQQPTQVAIQIPMDKLFGMVIPRRSIVLIHPNSKAEECCPNSDVLYGDSPKLNTLIDREKITIVGISPSPEIMIQTPTIVYAGAEMMIHTTIESMKVVDKEPDENFVYPGAESMKKIEWDDMFPLSLPFVMTYQCKVCGASHMVIGRVMPTREQILEINDEVQKQIERAKNLSNIVLPGSNIVLPK